MYAVLIAYSWTQAGSQTVWVCLLTDLSYYDVPSEYTFLNALSIQSYLKAENVIKRIVSAL